MAFFVVCFPDFQGILRMVFFADIHGVHSHHGEVDRVPRQPGALPRLPVQYVDALPRPDRQRRRARHCRLVIVLYKNTGAAGHHRKVIH